MDPVPLQIAPPVPPNGVDPLVFWLIGIMLSALTTVVGVLWRQSVAANQRKDELIDRLIDAGLENADANKRTTSLLEQEQRRHQR